MNKSNFIHAIIAAAMTLIGVLLGYPIAGATFAIAWFVSREHAHRQDDIADVTGVPVPQQNPLDGFKGWSLDSRLDALFAILAAIAVLGIYYANIN